MGSKKITQDSFGVTKDGEEVTRYTFTNDKNVTVKIINFGGIVTEILIPDKNGDVKDITLGYDDIEGYTNDDFYFGALVGRVANRIAGGKFQVDGEEYHLCANNGPNALHGGKRGFNKYVWKSKIEDDKLVLTHVSDDGNEGYPGELTATVTYSLTADSELVIEYEATTTKATPVNLTNHAYFNLAGHDCSVGLADHMIRISSDSYLPKDDTNIPTGDIAHVEGTPFDIRKPVRLGDRLDDIPGSCGFDHAYCIHKTKELKPVARVLHPSSGRCIEMSTTQPSIQCYSSFFVNVKNGKGGATYKKYQALCIEGQDYPDSVNHPNFPNTILRPGEKYNNTTIYKFCTS